MDVQEIQAVVFNILAFLSLLISALSLYEYSTSDGQWTYPLVQAGFLGPGARMMRFPFD